MSRPAGPPVGEGSDGGQDPFLKEKYNATLEMWFHENQWYWNITTIFGLACTALLGFLSSSGREKPFLGQMLQVLLAVIGIIICAMWAAAAERSGAMRSLRIDQLRRLEGVMGGGPLKDGEAFSNGDEYETLDGAVVQVSRLGKMARYKFSPVLATLFAIAFVVSGASSFYDMIN